ARGRRASAARLRPGVRAAAGRIPRRSGSVAAARPRARERPELRALPLESLVPPAAASGPGAEETDRRARAHAADEGAEILLKACIAEGEAVQSASDQSEAGCLGARDRRA